MTNERELGTIKMYNVERGFGFIERRVGEDVFLSRTTIERSGLSTVMPGEQVSFTIRRTDRGLQAESIQRIDVQSALTDRVVGQPLAQTPATAGAAQIGPTYLQDGYFEVRDSQPVIRPELLDGLAISIAHTLGQAGMKSVQLRRFLSRARGIESRFAYEGSYHTLLNDVYAFKRDIAYQVGRKLLPEPFQQFINRNIEVASTDPESFRRGFIPHFESVVAYFAYYFREQ